MGPDGIWVHPYGICIVAMTAPWCTLTLGMALMTAPLDCSLLHAPRQRPGARLQQGTVPEPEPEPEPEP